MTFFVLNLSITARLLCIETDETTTRCIYFHKLSTPGPNTTADRDDMRANLHEGTMSSEIDLDFLVRQLSSHNPWWNQGAKSLEDTLPAREKSDFYHLVRPGDPTTKFEDSTVFGLVGQHGVGKTMLMKQFIHHQLTEGVAPERFCYIPFGANALYQLQPIEQLRAVLNYYEGRVLGRLAEQDPHFLLFDDVHRIADRDKPSVEGWGTFIRNILDEASGRNIVVSAAATEQIEAELSRTGFPEADVDTQPILPEKFRDYIFDRYPDLEEGDTRVSPTPLQTGEGSLPRAITQNDPEVVAETIRTQYQRVADASRRIQSQVSHYLELGGVLGCVAGDGVADIGDVDSDAYQLLYSNLTATLYQDAPSLESLQTVSDLERLCGLAAENRGADPIRFQRLVELFDVDRRTIRDSYLSVLEQLFVLTGVTEYDNQRPRSVRLFLRDTGMVSALNKDDPSSVRHNLDYEADLARIAAFDHTMRFAYGMNARQGIDVAPSVQYWQGRYGEVDFVFEVDETPVPITMAYQTGMNEAIDAVEEFHTEYETQVGFVVTGDVVSPSDEIEVLEDGVVTVPYWLYLLLC